jgi:hypothetical protein
MVTAILQFGQFEITATEAEGGAHSIACCRPVTRAAYGETAVVVVVVVVAAVGANAHHFRYANDPAENQ